MRSVIRASVFFCSLLLPGCATPPLPHFQNDRRESDQRFWGRMLDRIGEAAPRTGETLVRFCWFRPFDDGYVITVGMDEDVGYLRMQRLDRRTRVWDRPQILFLEEVVVREVVHDRALQHCDWQDPGLGSDGAAWIFEGQGWSAYRCTPEPGEPWRALGLRLLALAGVEIDPDDIY